jgi:hypothetical protein
MAKHPAPARLGTKAKKLWTSVTTAYELRFDELRLLEDACREVDLVERLEDELRGADLTVQGSQGQPVANPLVQEVRQHRGQLQRLLAGLNLPDEDGRAQEQRSSSARDAANARWRRGA